MTPAPKRRFRRRFLAIAVLGTIFVGGATGLAFFLSHGTGSTTQNVTVGTAPNLSVNLLPQSVVGSALLPGGSAQTFLVRVNNSNNVSVSVTLTPAVKHDAAGGIFDTASHAFVDGCLSSWFTASMTGGGGPYIIQASTTPNLDTVSVALTDNGQDQSACENLTPEVDVTAS